MKIEESKNGMAYVIQAYKMGGPFMHLISIMGVIALLIVGIKVYRMVRRNEFDNRLLSLILMSGIFSLAWGMLSQIIGIIKALEAIRMAGDISPSLVYAGVILSFYAVIWGFIVFFICLVCYYILKEIIRNKAVVGK